MNNTFTSHLSDDEDYGYVVNVPETEPAQHTAAHPFCYDPACPCHEDSTLTDPVNEAYQSGELTAEEATDFTKGKLIYGGWSDDDDDF